MEKAPSIMLSSTAAAAEGETIFMAKFNLSPSDDEEEMREAGAREVCEETRGVGGVLTRNSIAVVPKAKKRQTQNERGTRGMRSIGGTSR